MGKIQITLSGSFGFRQEEFSAMDHGHARAVADAIRYLAQQELPEAISQDHKLHTEGASPEFGFGLPTSGMRR